MRQRGVSLIEVMISLVILLVGILGLAIAFQRSIFQTTSSRNDTAAMLIAQAIVDELEGHQFDDIPLVVAGLADEYHADFNGEYVPVGAADEYYVPSINVIDETQNTIRLEIRVNWTGWRDEFDRGGYGKDTAAAGEFAFTMNTAISRNYGDQSIAAGV